MPKSRLLPVLFCLAVLPASAQPVSVPGLGQIDFRNSGAEAAQEPFHRGVLLLHSFEFGPARAAFVEAQEADPGFALAFWGEAMASNYPLWRDRDLENGRAALSRLAGNPAARRARAGTEREAMYMDAIEQLYDDRSKAEQDLAYMEAMQALHEAWPEDDEARAFYALAILGSTNGERDFATYMRGAATVAPVFVRNPDHPGAAHYLIHSFDDPVHAPLGLPAAEAYSGIAPNAAHAQHMTSHIFVAMGMWDRVVAANIRAMDVQDGQRAERGLGPNACGHYSSWRHYGHLMLGQTADAEALMDACHSAVTAGSGSWFYFVMMRARHIVDTEDWSLAGRWTAAPPSGNPDNDASAFGGPAFTDQLTNALAALQGGDRGPAEALVAADWGPHPGRELQVTLLRGLMAIAGGEAGQGTDLIRQAAEAEAGLPFEFGPPAVVKPAWELLGEVLLRAGHNDEAEAAFRTALDRTPGRPLSEQGLRRARSLR